MGILLRNHFLSNLNFRLVLQNYFHLASCTLHGFSMFTGSHHQSPLHIQSPFHFVHYSNRFDQSYNKIQSVQTTIHILIVDVILFIRWIDCSLWTRILRTAFTDSKHISTIYINYYWRLDIMCKADARSM